MRGSYVLAVSTLLASLPAAALPEPEDFLAPAVYAGVSFGGSSSARDPHLGLRLDATRMPAGAGAPALVRWELRPQGTALTVAGRPLLASGGAAPGYADDARPAGAGKGVAIALLGTAAAVGVLGYLMGEFGEDFGEGVGNAVTEGFTGEGNEGSGAEACGGVQIGEECVGGG